MVREMNGSVLPGDLELPYGMVHIWHASLRATDSQLCRSRRVLTSDEMRRASRFRFDRDRKRFVMARALLRHILSAYTGWEPCRHSLEYNPYGKPFLRDGNPLRFSVSHSGGEALYAIAHDRDIGIDIEHIRSMEDTDAIVDRFFSEAEKATFHSLPENAKNRAFYSCWTRKEAYVKALGMGLSYPLDAFTVSFLPDEPPELKPAQSNMNTESDWTIEDICVNADHVAAVAVEGHGARFQHTQWSW